MDNNCLPLTEAGERFSDPSGSRLRRVGPLSKEVVRVQFIVDTLMICALPHDTPSPKSAADTVVITPPFPSLAPRQ